MANRWWCKFFKNMRDVFRSHKGGSALKLQMWLLGPAVSMTTWILYLSCSSLQLDNFRDCIYLRTLGCKTSQSGLCQTEDTDLFPHTYNRHLVQDLLKTKHIFVGVGTSLAPWGSCRSSSRSQASTDRKHGAKSPFRGRQDAWQLGRGWKCHGPMGPFPQVWCGKMKSMKFTWALFKIIIRTMSTWSSYWVGRMSKKNHTALICLITQDGDP